MSAIGMSISIIGHITRDELARLLSSTEAANGFANRFLWIWAERSEELPFGGNLVADDLDGIREAVLMARESVEKAERLNFDAEAADLWRSMYGALSAGKPGLLGATLGRAEAQVVRLGTLYALLDCASRINSHHLRAAIAVWEYCEASARYIFGDRLGDETADAILVF
jgi:hypothetical protein